MTETRAEYNAAFPEWDKILCRQLKAENEQLLQQIGAQEVDRVRHLERDELIYQVDSECDSQQELIDRLAQLTLDHRQIETALREQIEELEKNCKNERDSAHHYCRTAMAAEAWAKTWKAKAKFDRRGWLALWSGPWHCRRKSWEIWLARRCKTWQKQHPD